LISTGLPPLIRPRRTTARLLLAAAFLLGVMVVLFLFNPSENAFYPRCGLYLTTGLYCPGCGGLRSMHQLSRGHLVEALRCNALAVIAFPFAAVWTVRLGWRELRGLPWRPISLPLPWLNILLGVLIAFSILRNLRFSPFIYLAPP